MPSKSRISAARDGSGTRDKIISRWSPPVAILSRRDLIFAISRRSRFLERMVSNILTMILQYGEERLVQNGEKRLWYEFDHFRLMPGFSLCHHISKNLRHFP